ncbi:MAG: glycerol-3-phosphate dehydrogenase/oxidase [Beutenbergiaceae bacterium]
MSHPPKPASPGQLSLEQRALDWARAESETFDVVVIGGGITGVGAALDARSRGLSVLLVEATDIAAGTSSKSSKLIHGGLRYLEMLDFSLVREALGERKLLLQQIAPHLVKPVPFIWPLTHRLWERGYLGAGLALYDSMGGAGAVPMHRHLGKRRMQQIAPGLDPAAYVGGVHFHDAIEDDARYAMMVARTAAALGAAVLTQASALAIEAERGSAHAVLVRNNLTGSEVRVRTRSVVVAAGPWTEQVLALAGQHQSTVAVRPSKGIHIVVPGDRIQSQAGVLMRTEKSVLFVIPWQGQWLIGDTDTEWTQQQGPPVATSTDIDYLLAKVNTILRRHLTRDDIVGIFAGLRPLVQTDPTASTTKLSREHSVSSPAPGVYVIAGGKFTTYRVMAKDLVDAVVQGSDLSASPSKTADIALVGALGYHRLVDQADELARSTGVSEPAVRRLLDRYGSLAAELLQLIRQDPALGHPLPGAAPYLAVEATYAFLREGALSIADVLERRTRIRIQVADSGAACARQVAALGAAVLGWSQREQTRQVQAYRRSLAAERAAHAEPTDAQAVAAYHEHLAAT